MYSYAPFATVVSHPIIPFEVLRSATKVELPIYSCCTDDMQQFLEGETKSPCKCIVINLKPLTAIYTIAYVGWAEITKKGEFNALRRRFFP